MVWGCPSSHVHHTMGHSVGCVGAGPGCSPRGHLGIPLSSQGHPTGCRGRRGTELPRSLGARRGGGGGRGKGLRPAAAAAGRAQEGCHLPGHCRRMAPQRGSDSTQRRQGRQLAQTARRGVPGAGTAPQPAFTARPPPPPPRGGAEGSGGQREAGAGSSRVPQGDGEGGGGVGPGCCRPCPWGAGHPPARYRPGPAREGGGRWSSCSRKALPAALPVTRRCPARSPARSPARGRSEGRGTGPPPARGSPGRR